MALEEPARNDGPPVSTESPPDEPTGGTRVERRSGSGSRTRTWLVVTAAVIVVGGALGLFLALAGGTKGTGPAPAPSRAAFTFPLTGVTFVAMNVRQPTEKARDVAASVRERLSAFYGEAFLDPRSWAGPPPADVWGAFAPAARPRARKDAPAFTLSGVGRVTHVVVTSSSLQVQVLYDPQGRPTAATAVVDFQTAATQPGGRSLDVVSTANMLLRKVSGKWLIVGYASANTQVADSADQPSAAPSGSATP